MPYHRDYARSEMAPSTYDLLVGALGRALHDPAPDASELQRAIVACAEAAKERDEPSQRFVIHIKDCVRRATVRKLPSDVVLLMSRVVTCAVHAYFERSSTGHGTAGHATPASHDRVR